MLPSFLPCCSRHCFGGLPLPGESPAITGPSTAILNPPGAGQVKHHDPAGISGPAGGLPGKHPAEVGPNSASVSTSPSSAPPAIEISGWLKTENVVKGQQEWEVARISVVFYDAKGNRLGDWPLTVAQVQGTHDWALYDNQYSPPKGTAWATLEISLGNCTGEGLVFGPADVPL